MLCIFCNFCRLDPSCSSVPVARQQSPPIPECAVHAERTCTSATSAVPSTTMRKIRFYATRAALVSMPNLMCTWNTSLARQSTPSRQRRTGRRCEGVGQRVWFKCVCSYCSVVSVLVALLAFPIAHSNHGDL